MAGNIDWRRLKNSLHQVAKLEFGEGDEALARMRYVAGLLEDVVPLCGETTKTKKMLLRLGTVLVKTDTSKILVPVCPDYAHDGEKYTFNGLNGGISLLTQKHIAFLRSLFGILPEFQVLLLMADHEADDAALVRTTGKTKEEFLELLDSSIEQTRMAVAPFGWQVERMTSVFPSLVQDEREIYQWISNEPKFQQRIVTDTIKRMGMYAKYGNLGVEEMRERTARTSAQYMALGRFAAREGFLICNHTTTNLSWYLQTEAAVLHNPIEVY